MNARELMIGDWVEPHQCRIPTLYCKVEGIYPDNTVHLDKAERLFSLGELHPIPLTADILEKNGFEWRAYGVVLAGEDMALVQCGDYWKIKPNQDSNDTFCYIWYVHELQHALRLCGIDNEIVINEQ